MEIFKNVPEILPPKVAKIIYQYTILGTGTRKHKRNIIGVLRNQIMNCIGMLVYVILHTDA